MIIGGLRLYGRVDETRAGFVVTRFFHIWFVPLVPLSSFFVTDGSAVQIPLSPKSIVVAYLRSFAVLLALGCVAGLIYRLAFGFFGELQIYMDGGQAVTRDQIVESVTLLAVLTAGSLGGVVLFALSRLLRKANAPRCGELARITGLPITPL